MKWFKYSKLLLILLVFLFGRFSCQDEKNDPCDDTKWPEMRNYSVQPKLDVSGCKLPEDRVLKEANKLVFQGSVRKYHCGGHLSDSYPMETIHDPGAISGENWENGFYVGKVYGFDFDNDEDRLDYVYMVRATFDDGAVYETAYELVSVKPPFIPDWTKNYFIITIGGEVEWYPPVE